MPATHQLPALQAVPDADRPAVAEIVDRIRAGEIEFGQHMEWMVRGFYAYASPERGHTLIAVNVARIVATLEP